MGKQTVAECVENPAILDVVRGCGVYCAHGYAVAPKISAALNGATKNCYKFGGKDCVIRAWACDARG